MPQDHPLEHPYAYHAKSQLCIRFPWGTRLINLREEDHHPEEENGPFTALCSLWIVEHAMGDVRRIACPETGAVITPTVERLQTQFTSSLLGWHYTTGKGILHTVIGETSLRHLFFTVRSAQGETLSLHRDQLLPVARPHNMKWEFKARGFIPL